MAISKRTSKSGKVTYRVKVHVGYDGTKRREITKSCDTKKEALAEEARLKIQVEQGTWAEPNRLNFGQYLDEWLEKAAKVKLKRQTWELYSNIVRIYIKPTLGCIPLARITPINLEGLYAQLRQGDKPKSPQTIKNVHTVVRGALKQAVRWRYLSHSPAVDVDTPRVNNAKKIRSLDPDQALAFLEAARTDHWGLILTFALISGARPGEYLGLTWDDINWQEGTARIEKNLVRPQGGGWILDVPKTKKSIRTVHLTPELIDLLKIHHTHQSKARTVLADTWQTKEHFVFTNQFGGPLDEKKVQRRWFQKTLQKAKITGPFRLYDLRHTCATLLLLAGEPAKVVSERLGHASVTTTLDIYSHVLPHLQHRATERLRFLLTPNSGK